MNRFKHFSLVELERLLVDLRTKAKKLKYARVLSLKMFFRFCINRLCINVFTLSQSFDSIASESPSLHLLWPSPSSSFLVLFSYSSLISLSLFSKIIFFMKKIVHVKPKNYVTSLCMCVFLLEKSFRDTFTHTQN